MSIEEFAKCRFGYIITGVLVLIVGKFIWYAYVGWSTTHTHVEFSAHVVPPSVK